MIIGYYVSFGLDPLPTNRFLDECPEPAENKNHAKLVQLFGQILNSHHSPVLVRFQGR